jgi:hypothetical protein
MASHNRVVGYGSFSLWVNDKEDLCPGSGDINRLMMIIRYLDLFFAPTLIVSIVYARLAWPKPVWGKSGGISPLA